MTKLIICTADLDYPLWTRHKSGVYSRCIDRLPWRPYWSRAEVTTNGVVFHTDAVSRYPV